MDHHSYPTSLRCTGQVVPVFAALWFRTIPSKPLPTGCPSDGLAMLAGADGSCSPNHLEGTRLVKFVLSSIVSWWEEPVALQMSLNYNALGH